MENSGRTSKSLHINQDVIARIIINCIEEIDGVHSVAPVMKTARQIWFRQENFGNIRIGLSGDVLTVSVGIILEEGAKAVTVAEEIQNKVKESVQTMLGLTVAKVNVNVCGIYFEK